MSNLEPRSGKRLTRKQREAKAFRLVAASGTFGAIAVVTFLLAIVSSFSMAIPVLSAILAVVCFVLFRRSVGLG